jgi:hypothetical protein
MLGGVLWIVGAVIVALQPEGCVASDCYLPGRTMRDSNVAAPIFIAAVGLMAAGIGGAVQHARGPGRLGRMGQIGVGLGVGGVALLAGALLVQALAFGGDFPYMPTLVLPGILAVSIGFVLVAIDLVRARVFPRWAGGILAIGALALLISNEQNQRVLFMIPFGLAWIAMGYALWRIDRSDVKT